MLGEDSIKEKIALERMGDAVAERNRIWNEHKKQRQGGPIESPCCKKPLRWSMDRVVCSRCGNIIERFM